MSTSITKQDYEYMSELGNKVRIRLNEILNIVKNGEYPALFDKLYEFNGSPDLAVSIPCDEKGCIDIWDDYNELLSFNNNDINEYHLPLEALWSDEALNSYLKELDKIVAKNKEDSREMRYRQYLELKKEFEGK